MTDLQWKATLAGLCFGIWPLLMNRSGLSGNVSSLVFVIGAGMILLPFAAGNLRNGVHPVWIPMILACLFSAVGLLSFNGMLAKATQQEVSSLFIMMIVVQTTVPAIYHVAVNGGLSLQKALGFAAAFLAAILLTRS